MNIEPKLLLQTDLEPLNDGLTLTTPEVTGSTDNKLAFHDSLNRYITTDFNSKTHKKARLESEQEQKIAEMISCYDLLEPLLTDKDTPEDNPMCTVCIPVAITSEPIEAIANLLKFIQTSQKKSGKPVEVIIWANAKYREDDRKEVDEQARERYQMLRDFLDQKSIPGVFVRTALEISSAEEASISKVRANYMDACIVDAAKRDFGYEHPILWLDADTTSFSPSALENLSESVRSFEALFVYPRVLNVADWAKGKLLTEMDAATKAIVIHEMTRRQSMLMNDRDPRLNQMTNPDVPPLNAYSEESGMTFALGTYMQIGGIDTSDKFNESHHLQQRALGATTPDYLAHEGRTIDLRQDNIEVKLGLSARRKYEKVKQRGPISLSEEDTLNYEGLYTDMNKSEEDAVQIFQEDMYLLWLKDGRANTRSRAFLQNPAWSDVFIKLVAASFVPAPIPYEASYAQLEVALEDFADWKESGHRLADRGYFKWLNKKPSNEKANH